MLAVQHPSSFAHRARTRIALDRPSVCSASPGHTQPQTGPPGAPTAPPDTKLRCRAHQHAHDARRADSKMSRARLSACHACRAGTARLSQETLSVTSALRVFSQTQLPSPPAPNARWDRAHQQRHRRHASRNHPERPTARSVRPGRSVLAEQHLRSCARQVGTQVATGRPSAYSASRDATPLSMAPRHVTTALPDSQLVIRRQSSAPLAKPALTHQSSRLRALRVQPAHRQVPPPSRRLTASASRTTGESAKCASPAWHMPFALPRQSNL